MENFTNVETFRKLVVAMQKSPKHFVSHHRISDEVLEVTYQCNNGKKWMEPMAIKVDRRKEDATVTFTMYDVSQEHTFTYAEFDQLDFSFLISISISAIIHKVDNFARILADTLDNSVSYIKL